MDNYSKGEVKEIESEVSTNLPISAVAVHMKVSGGSKIRNLMGFAIKKIKEPTIHQITWNGSGAAVTKTISCAEIMKRKVKGLHQITSISYRRIEEYWEPKMEGLERLKVNRDIPAVTILLSKDPLDATLPGYQAPGSFDSFWKSLLCEDNTSQMSRQKQKKHQNAAQHLDTSNIEIKNPKKKRKQTRTTKKQDKTKTSQPEATDEEKKKDAQ